MSFQPNILKEINSSNNVANKMIDNLTDIVFNSNDLSIFHCNIRSINLHFNEILVYLKTITQPFEIIILTETWLSEYLNFDINGYITYNFLGLLKKADGVTIFIRNNVNITDLNTNIIRDWNSIEINFKFNELNYKIIGIYRSPSLAINNFLMGIDAYLSNISNTYKVIIICGDMNNNIPKKSSNVSNYLNIQVTYNFISCIDSLLGLLILQRLILIIFLLEILIYLSKFFFY
jgi:exonuclease III